MADIHRLPGAQLDHWDWQLNAACRGMDSSVFFHPPNERNAARENRAAGAKAICQVRPVVAECLDHALRVREPYGVWGGRTEDERARLLGVQSLRYPAMLHDAGSEERSRQPAMARVTDRKNRNSA